MRRPVLVIHKGTREIVERYRSVTEADAAYGLKPGSVSSICIKRRLCSGPHYLRFEDDFDPNEDFTGKRNCAVVGLKPETGELTFWNNKRECMKALGITQDRLTSLLKTQRRINGLVLFECTRRTRPVFKTCGECDRFTPDPADSSHGACMGSLVHVGGGRMAYPRVCAEKSACGFWVEKIRRFK